MVITVGLQGGDDGADITNAGKKNIQQMMVCMIWLGT
jgi:hypothetical protein